MVTIVCSCVNRTGSICSLLIVLLLFGETAYITRGMFFATQTRLLPAEVVGAVGANGENPASMRFRGWFGTGGSQGALWRQSGGSSIG